MKLTADDKGKEVKVVILAHQGVETRPQFITADQELSGLLAMHLQRSFKADKQKAVVVPSAQVKKYKDDHPDWQMDLHETGKHFNADYVIDLEIQSLSLYEKGSASQLYRGRADIEVSVLDLHHPDEAPVQKFYHGEYPNGRPIPVEDRNPLEFRQAFLDDIAQHISWYFVPHQIEAEFASDM